MSSGDNRKVVSGNVTKSQRDSHGVVIGTIPCLAQPFDL